MVERDDVMGCGEELCFTTVFCTNAMLERGEYTVFVQVVMYVFTYIVLEGIQVRLTGR